MWTPHTSEKLAHGLYNRDDLGNKPWTDGSKTPSRDFYLANSTWLPTWGEGDSRDMIVKSVKMWQQGKC